jgi:nitrogen fixation protein
MVIYPDGTIKAITLAVDQIRSVQGCGLINKKEFPDAQVVVDYSDAHSEQILLVANPYDDIIRQLPRVKHLPLKRAMQLNSEPTEPLELESEEADLEYTELTPTRLEETRDFFRDKLR